MKQLIVLTWGRCSAWTSTPLSIRRTINLEVTKTWPLRFVGYVGCKDQVSWYFLGRAKRSSLLLCLKKDVFQPVSGAVIFPLFGLYRCHKQEALEKKVIPQLHREQKGRQTLFWWFQIFQIIQCIKPLGVVIVCPLYSIYLETKCFLY